MPRNKDIFVRLGDIPFSRLDGVVASKLTHCIKLDGMVASDTRLDHHCQAGATGRYVYVFVMDDAEHLSLWEVYVYGDPAPDTRMYTKFLIWPTNNIQHS